MRSSSAKFCTASATAAWGDAVFTPPAKDIPQAEGLSTLGQAHKDLSLGLNRIRVLWPVTVSATIQNNEGESEYALVGQEAQLMPRSNRWTEQWDRLEGDEQGNMSR